MSVDTVAETTELVITREFDAPRERVWGVFTKPEHVQKWWGPIPFSAPVTEIDLRAGGAFRFAMRSPDGRDYWNAGTVRELAPPQRLVLAMYFANEKGERVAPSVYGFPEGSPAEQITSFEFEAIGKRTRLTLRQGPIPTGMGQNAKLGWTTSLEKAAHAIADDMKVRPAGDREIVITRTFNAPRALVYEALTRAEHVKRWWGPRQYGPVEATTDFRPGGRYRYAQQSPQGEVAFSGEIRESSLERIVYTEGFEAMPGHEAIVTVTLEARDGKTLVTVSSLYQSREDRDAVISSGMEWGARLSYLQLDDVLESLSANTNAA